MADMLVPAKSNGSVNGKDKSDGDKALRVIEYVLGKLKFVIEQNEEYF